VLFRDNLHNYRLDIALNYSEIFDKENRTLQKCWTIEDGGDLSTFNAYETIDGTDLVIDTTIQLNTLSNLQVYNQQHQIFYHWKDGIRIL
jgi:hypothetical protein